ncbi:MAG TPA: hypothetical protein VJ867_03745 [Gemmatimonadaceae bacterium]|nr:hypothetical protein [Gemmatimonadaceae bacterium]
MESTRTSRLEFTYGGAVSGTFQAVGEHASTPGQTSAWTYGQRLTQSGAVRILASSPIVSGKSDQVTLGIARLTPGSETFGVCGNYCTLLGLGMGVKDAGGFDWACNVTSGTATLTSLTQRRAVGTFSGSGECYASGSFDPAPFTVSNGSFDVLIQNDLAASRSP